MNIAGFDNVILSREQQRLLGGWRDILDDLRHLCRSLMPFRTPAHAAMARLI